MPQRETWYEDISPQLNQNNRASKVNNFDIEWCAKNRKCFGYNESTFKYSNRCFPVKQQWSPLAAVISLRYSSSRNVFTFLKDFGTEWCWIVEILFPNLAMCSFISALLNIGIFSRDVLHLSVRYLTDGLLLGSPCEDSVILDVALTPMRCCFHLVYRPVGSGSTIFLSFPILMYSSTLIKISDDY